MRCKYAELKELQPGGASLEGYCEVTKRVMVAWQGCPDNEECPDFEDISDEQQ